MCYFIFYCIVFQYLYNLKLVPTTFHFTCTVAIKISYVCVSSFLMMSSVWRIISTLNHTCDFNQKSENWCESSSGWDKSLTKFSQGFPLNSIYFLSPSTKHDDCSQCPIQSSDLSSARVWKSPESGEQLWERLINVSGPHFITVHPTCWHQCGHKPADPSVSQCGHRDPPGGRSR